MRNLFHFSLRISISAMAGLSSSSISLLDCRMSSSIPFHSFQDPYPLFPCFHREWKGHSVMVSLTRASPGNAGSLKQQLKMVKSVSCGRRRWGSSSNSYSRVALGEFRVMTGRSCSIEPFTIKVSTVKIEPERTGLARSVRMNSPYHSVRPKAGLQSAEGSGAWRTIQDRLILRDRRDIVSLRSVYRHDHPVPILLIAWSCGGLSSCAVIFAPADPDLQNMVTIAVAIEDCVKRANRPVTSVLAVCTSFRRSVVGELLP